MLRRRWKPSVGHRSDSALLQEIVNGNSQAIAALYERYGDFIYRFSVRLSGDKEVAEEVTHEVFLVMIRRAGHFEAARSQLSTWLCSIARNLIWEQMNKNRRWQQVNPLDAEPQTQAIEDDPYALLERTEAKEVIRRGVDMLPLHLKEMIILCELEELPYQTVAEVLSLPVGTVRSRLSRAKTQLANLLRTALERP